METMDSESQEAEKSQPPLIQAETSKSRPQSGRVNSLVLCLFCGWNYRTGFPFLQRILRSLRGRNRWPLYTGFPLPQICLGRGHKITFLAPFSRFQSRLFIFSYPSRPQPLKFPDFPPSFPLIVFLFFSQLHPRRIFPMSNVQYK